MPGFVLGSMPRRRPSDGFHLSCGVHIDMEGNIRIWATNNEDLTLKLETRPITGQVKDIAWCPESKRVVAVGDGSERCA